MVKDIVDTAVGAGQFNTLVAALQAAGLESTLRGPGPFTVFAPTDAAFAKLPPGTVDDLLKPENKAKLAAILTYHVLPAEVPASAVAMQTVEPATVEGKMLKVVGNADGVMVNNAKVIMADVDASNGVIHAIDTVLMPPM
ncbi:MAG: fasciclin domain-containing protein [Alphaproteobacteria bacterium]|nr:fasciclin domain-containing protein [Alphaproteobacteria bacterium]